MPNAIIGLGSNIGDRVKYIEKSITKISDFLRIRKISSVYQSDSLLTDGQIKYYNIVLSGDTYYKAVELLYILKNIEKEVGRVKRGKWKEREIDLDIIDFDRNILQSEELVLPHKHMHKRSFVLYPLREIEPAYIHPEINLNIDKMMAQLENNLDIRKIGEIEWQL